MNTRVKSTAILMALIITLSAFTSLAATTAAAAATTTPAAEAVTTATPTTTPAAATTATPSIVAATPTTTTITASNTNPTVGSGITLSVTVKAGSTVLTNEIVGVSHTYPGSTTPATDGAFNTGSTGTATFSSGTYGSAGQRIYAAAFVGDSQYAASTGFVTVNVGTTTTKATTTTITASNTNPTVGSGITLSVTVKAGSTVLTNEIVGVSHTYPGSTTPATDGAFNTGSTGTATFSSGTYGSAGQRIYAAAFVGDSQYAASTGFVTVNVRSPTTATITASNTNPVVNQGVTFTVNLKSGTTGLSAPIKLWYTKDGGPRIDRAGTFSTTNGVYTFSGPFGSAGTYVYHAEYAGDNQYAASSGTVTVNVGKIPTTLAITASKTNPQIFFWSNEQITITITLQAGSTGLSKSIKLWLTDPYGTRWDDGTHTTTYSYTTGFNRRGTYSLHAEFAGDSQYASSSGDLAVNVQGVPTTTTITASDEYPAVGQSVTFTITMKVGGTPNSEPVTIWHTENGARVEDGTQKTDTNGVYTFIRQFSSKGQYVYHAEFAADYFNEASAGTVTVNVGTTPTTTTITASNTNPTVNQMVTLTVNLKSGTTGLSKPIKLWYTKDGGPRIDKVGTFSTTNGVYVFSGPFGHSGTYVYHAEFAGDSQYGASSGTVTVNVQPIPTTTTITASETNPTFSQLIIFKVTLKAGTTGLSKAVKIWHTDPNGVLIELNPQNTINGVYSWGMSFSDPGQYVFHAEFAGDSQYAPSSGTVTVNVQSS